ncbi:MAG: mechanosensitive ion channel [Candidatus Woesearchaeota archaeon]
MALLEFWSEAQGWVNMIASAVIVLLIGFIIGKVLGKLAQRGLHEVELNRILGKAGIKFGMEELIGRSIECLIYFIAIVVALDQLGVTAIVLYIVIAAVLVVVVIAFLLSIKDFIPNFIAGIRLSHKKLFNVGDTITAGSVSGKVREIGLLETKLVSRNKDIIHIPNSSLVRQEIRVRRH